MHKNYIICEFLFELSRKCRSSSTDSEVPVFVIIMEMSSERAYKTCNAERSKEIMQDLNKRKPKWQRGHPMRKLRHL